MKKIIIFCLFLLCYLNATEYKSGCPVPHNLIEAIKLTENAEAYPYYIRTNDKNLNKFYSVVGTNKYKKTSDPMLINCLNEFNCVYITYNLINNGITNIDLGLFQINYNSYPRNIFHYFNEEQAYMNACGVVVDKIRNTRKWNWETLANYHSATPSLNLIYKNKLIQNYTFLEGKSNNQAYNK